MKNKAINAVCCLFISTLISAEEIKPNQTFILNPILPSSQLSVANEDSLPVMSEDSDAAIDISQRYSVDEPFQYDLSKQYNSFNEESGWVSQIWGRPSRDHLYLGMWTHHLDPGDDQENKNDLVGGSYKGYYAGTFINTHRDRVYTAGWQRTLYQTKWGALDVEAGYRAGMMYGYTKYLQLFHTKFFPLFQTLLNVDYNGFGMQFTWAGVVLTAGFYYRF